MALMNRPIAALEQSWLRTKARDFAGYHAGRRRSRPIRRTTRSIADAEGHIAYLHPQFVPIRDDRFDYREPVDGSDPATDWHGLHAARRAARRCAIPPNGWLYNTNDCALARGRRRQPAARRPSRATWTGRRQSARRPCHDRCSAARSDFTPDGLRPHRLRSLAARSSRELVPQLVAAWTRCRAAIRCGRGSTGRSRCCAAGTIAGRRASEADHPGQCSGARNCGRSPAGGGRRTAICGDGDDAR